MNKKQCLYIDSEWSSQSIFLSFSLRYQEKIYFFYNQNYFIIEKVLKEFHKENFFSIPVNADQLENQQKSLFDQFVELEFGVEIEEKLCFDVYFFYSIKDLRYFFSNQILDYARMNYPSLKRKMNFLIQKKKIDGRIQMAQNITIHLKDLYGLSSKKGLNNLIETLGIKDLYKGICDQWKDQMERYLEKEEDTLKFIFYSINDVILLEKIHQRIPEVLNDILYEKKPIITMENLPMGMGTIVSNAFENFLFDQFGERKKELEELNKLWKVKKYYGNEKRKSKEEISSLISGSSISSYFYLHNRDSGNLLSIVGGGRTNNEQWDQFEFENVFDLDFQSCYGTALKDFDYPIGLPSVFCKVNNTNKTTLKEFLNQYEKELVENLYIILLNGTLDFSQTLLYSKLTNSQKINQKLQKALNSEEEINEETSGDFRILTNQLINTILTSDILHGLKKMCTNQEWNQLLACEVIAASFYKKSDERTKEDFLTQYQKTERIEAIQYEIRTQSIEDNRPRIWTRIPIKDFIEPLLNQRKTYKKQMETVPDMEMYYGLQLWMKNLINTLYGSIASSYFEISNTVVANNITARARLNIWLASRPLKGIQCITDGFAYQPQQVYQIKVKKKLPGFQTLSDYEKIEKHKSIQIQSLNNLDWKPLFQKEVTFEKYPNLDQLVKQHLDRFWDHYQIKIPYEIEHKKENTSVFLFTIKKAHYAMKTIDGKTFYKFRGISGPTVLDETKDLPIYYKISNHILHGEEFTIETLEERTRGISKLSDFIESKKTNQLIYPGESIIKRTFFQLTNDDFLIEDENSLKKRDVIDYSVYLF